MTDVPQPGLLNALLAFSTEAPKLRKDATNPAFRSKYTPLDTLVEQVGPILQKHQLVWTTLPVSGENGPALFYRLAHVPSGETLDGTMPLLLGKGDSQGLGSAITYARRYSLCAVLNLVADDDDDGNGAASFGARPSSTQTASPAQLKLLKSLITQHRAPEKSLRIMLADVGASDLDPSKTGWSSSLMKDQASALIERFKTGSVPTGESDIPTDDFLPSSVAEEAGDVPWGE